MTLARAPPQPEAINTAIDKVLAAPDLATGLDGFSWSSDKVGPTPRSAFPAWYLGRMVQ